MAALADVVKGFEGTVNTADTPDVFGRGVRYAVGGATDLKVTAGGAGDRSVTVTIGKAWGDAVLAKWNSATVRNAGANTSGSMRWDTLVVRRDWAAKTATLMLIAGGTSQALAPTVILRNPTASTGAGYTTADQPLYLVGVANGAATISAANIIDLRLWSGEGGGLWGAHMKARDYITSIGTTVRIGDELHTRILDGTGTPQWDVKDLHRMEAVARDNGDGIARLVPRGAYGLGAQFSVSDLDPTGGSWYGQRGTDNAIAWGFDGTGKMTAGTVPKARQEDRWGSFGDFAPEFSGTNTAANRRYYGLAIPVKPYGRRLTMQVFAYVDVPPRNGWRMNIEWAPTGSANTPGVAGSAVLASQHLNGEADGMGHHVAMTVAVNIAAGEAKTVRVWLQRVSGNDGCTIGDHGGYAFRADFDELGGGNDW